jgi:hypothetical protein
MIPCIRNAKEQIIFGDIDPMHRLSIRELFGACIHNNTVVRSHLIGIQKALFHTLAKVQHFVVSFPACFLDETKRHPQHDQSTHQQDRMQHLHTLYQHESPSQREIAEYDHVAVGLLHVPLPS